MKIKGVIISEEADKIITKIEDDNRDDMSFYQGWYQTLNNGIESLINEVQSGIPTNSRSLGNKKYAFSFEIGYIIYVIINNRTIQITGFEFLFLPNQRIGKIESFECNVFWNEVRGNGLSCLAYDNYNGNVIYFYLAGRTTPFNVSSTHYKFLIVQGKIKEIDAYGKITLDLPEIIVEDKYLKTFWLLNENFLKLGVSSDIIDRMREKQLELLKL